LPPSKLSFPALTPTRESTCACSRATEDDFSSLAREKERKWLSGQTENEGGKVALALSLALSLALAKVEAHSKPREGEDSQSGM